MAEVQEQKSFSKTYEIMGKKLESELRLKDSEIIYLGEKLEESNRLNRLLEKRLNQSGQLSMPVNLHRSGLSPSHFLAVVRFTVKSIRSFVKLMIDQMKAADWNLDPAADSIVQDVFYWRDDDKCFAFESFVCREMFSSFHLPNFSVPSQSLTWGKESATAFFQKIHRTKIRQSQGISCRESQINICKILHGQVLATYSSPHGKIILRQFKPKKPCEVR